MLPIILGFTLVILQPTTANADTNQIAKNSKETGWSGLHRERAKGTAIAIAINQCYEFTTPGFPKYKNGIEEFYKFTTDSNAYLVMKDFLGHLQKSPGCSKDFLKVFTGIGDKYRLCTKKGEYFKIISDKNVLEVQFKSNAQYRSRGYKANICSFPYETTTTSTTTPVPTTTTPTPVLCDDMCGVRPSVGRLGSTVPLSEMNGWNVLVDVFYPNAVGRCAGYIISRKHVVTAGTCFKHDFDYYGVLTNDSFGVYEGLQVRVTAGQFHLQEANETETVQEIFSSEYHVYNDGLIYSDRDPDIAIIILPDEGFVQNYYVYPVCLPYSGSTTLFDAALNLKVYASGFGYSTRSAFPLMMQRVVEDISLCGFSLFPSPHMMCFTSNDPVEKGGPCPGDPGTSVFAFDDTDKAFVLGHFYYDAKTTLCPIGYFAAAMKIIAFKDWIDGITGFRYCQQ